MLAVPLPREELLPLMGGGLSVAGLNGPSLTVAAGATEAVEALEGQLLKAGIACRRLETTHAFHSTMVEPIAGAFTRLMRSVRLQPPRIPYVSNVTGDWITDAEATDPDYWTRHLCGAVRFAGGIQTLRREPGRVLLEVGPGQMLCSLAAQQAGTENGAAPRPLASLRYAYEQHPDLSFLLNTLGQLWLAGVKLDWPGFYARERRRRVELPTYPFERKRYWVEARPFVAANAPPTSTGERASMGDAGEGAAALSAHARPHLSNAYVEPGSPTEQAVAEIWRHLLGIEEVGAHDDFFQLGGNSLLGIQLTARLRQAFQVDIPVHALFQAPTVAGLALLVEDTLLAEIEGMSEGDLSLESEGETPRGSRRRSSERPL